MSVLLLSLSKQLATWQYLCNYKVIKVVTHNEHSIDIKQASLKNNLRFWFIGYRLAHRKGIQLSTRSKYFFSNGSDLTENKKVGCLVFIVLNKNLSLECIPILMVICKAKNEIAR